MSSVKILDNFRVFIREFFFPFREIIVGTARENTNCVRENLFQITYVKMEACVREKYNFLFPWNLVNFSFLVPVKKKISSVKIIKFSLYPSREKENPPVKKSKNASVKNLVCPWKSGKKCAWKRLFLPWKKSKKRPKMAFTGTFDFHGEKRKRC